jgi:serine O-acetyltransferase
MARLINYWSRVLTGADVHPGATVGNGFFIDHATGVVIGETTIIGDNVSIFQGVTLGGVSTTKEKRHPTLGNNVTIGAHATILGDILIGDNSKVGAGSVVVKDVPPNSTVVGIPGIVVKRNGEKEKKVDLPRENLPDPLVEALTDICTHLDALDKRVGELEDRLKKS